MARKKMTPAPARKYVRFRPSDRMEHLLMLISFITLAITGLVQKFALNPVSVLVVRLWGGIENIRATHHVAATVLMLVVIVHLLETGYKAFVLRSRFAILPGLQDVKDAWLALRYNLGIAKSRPQFGRYSFEEKAEYWALVWGILIMGLTGFMMWNPLATVRVMPGDFIPAAKMAHGAEAILAVLAIFVWHMYGVHLRRFNKSMWTGQLSEEEMSEEHPLELADLKSGLVGGAVDGPTLRKRRMVYYPVAGILAVGMLLGVYGFVSGEQTAITTVPPEIAALPVYVPQTPTPLPPTPTTLPSPTSGPTAEVTAGVAAPATWTEVGPLFEARCGACHSSTVATAGLSLATYAEALKGGQDGAAIVPGDAANSPLMTIQTKGDHPGQLAAGELDLVQAWIDAGAPER